MLTAACGGSALLCGAVPDASSSSNDLVELPTFSVKENSDIGYRASNSVSATRVDTPIKDLPFALSAFTKQFMNDIGARDLDDVVQYAAGATHAGRNSLGGDALYSVRGFPQAPQRDGFVTPNSGGVLTGPYVDTVNIERVEVVKGPASVLYGQVAPGGIINYVTKKPTDKRIVSLTQKVGSYGYLRSQADINQPLGDTGLLFRFNGSGKTSSSTSTPLNRLSNTTGTFFEASKTTPQVGLGYKITPDVMLYANYSTSFQQNAAFLSTDNVITGPAKPTISNGYEASVKTDFMGGKISSTLSYYEIYQDDRVVNLSYVTPAGLIVTNTIQGTRDLSRGMDLEMTVAATDHLQFYASFALDDVRVRQVPRGYNYYLGAHPEATAKTLANLWARYNCEGTLKGLWLEAPD